MSSAPDEAAGPRVWITVIDPETADGRQAIVECDKAIAFEWAVPAGASSGDFVLAWVTGGTGFRYLLSIQSPPRKASDDEFGPQQAMLQVVEPIDPLCLASMRCSASGISSPDW